MMAQTGDVHCLLQLQLYWWGSTGRQRTSKWGSSAAAAALSTSCTYSKGTCASASMFVTIIRSIASPARVLHTSEAYYSW